VCSDGKYGEPIPILIAHEALLKLCRFPSVEMEMAMGQAIELF
jgi:hypothetical protein